MILDKTFITILIVFFSVFEVECQGSGRDRKEFKSTLKQCSKESRRSGQSEEGGRRQDGDRRRPGRDDRQIADDRRSRGSKSKKFCTQSEEGQCVTQCVFMAYNVMNRDGTLNLQGVSRLTAKLARDEAEKTRWDQAVLACGQTTVSPLYSGVNNCAAAGSLCTCVMRNIRQANLSFP
ncbi:uncharacterized protein LOC134535851 [Bacillus rossius redtenbacheri]|uniref:uncharacterized protein LOC134535851 n=1 Tax=Bacillus rossius redtenbacheri TaxID=93214 RepID=UPI002FDE90AD